MRGRQRSSDPEDCFQHHLDQKKKNSEVKSQNDSKTNFYDARGRRRRRRHRRRRCRLSHLPRNIF